MSAEAVLAGENRWAVVEGDCVEVLRGLPDASVDAVCTDPPYGLEFMGKDWDSLGVEAPTGHDKRGINDPEKVMGYQDGSRGNAFSRSRVRMGKAENSGPAMQAWHLRWAEEALRVLKPGGHLLAFGGTRTNHRLACAIEDAGFEIRDSVTWIYGCLSEDTEILVNGRWEPYHRAIEGSLALCYDAGRDAFRWLPIQEQYVYPHDGQAFRVIGEATDQIVTPEHRVPIKREGRYEFVRASEAAREHEVRTPVLEGLRDLLDVLPLPRPLPGGPEDDLLVPVRVGVVGAEEAWQADSYAPAPGHEGSEVCGLREVEMEAACVVEASPPPDVLSGVQRRPARTGVGRARAQGPRGVERGLGAVVSTEDVRPEQSCLEGRRDLLPQEGELRVGEVCAVPVGIPVDGSQGRIRDGAPTHRGEGHRTSPSADGGRPPRQSRPDGQPTEEPDAVLQQRGAQTVRGAGHTRAALARVEPTYYRGTVWCVRTPTGAFVARRNGKVFVTGNSGFPKSLNVSKAIDKAAGAEREVVGHDERVNVYEDGKNHKFYSEEEGNPDYGKSPITAPATDDAKEWDGWGTALKPAHEPIVVARKPLAGGTVAANVLEHGTGALNIGATRIGSETIETVLTTTGGLGDAASGIRGTGEKSAHTGRWPANIALSHAEGCELVGERKVRGSVNHHRSGTSIGDHTVEDWRCVEGCPVRELDAQSGDLKTTYITPGHKNTRDGGPFPLGHPGAQGYDDSGGASRFFYQAKATGNERWIYCADCDAAAPRTAQGERHADCPLHGDNPATADFGPLFGGGGGTCSCPRTVRDAHKGHDIEMHPTQKPVDLMSWLVRLVTPPGGVVLDPFVGSGTTVLAALRGGFRAVGVERHGPYARIANSRVAAEFSNGRDGDRA